MATITITIPDAVVPRVLAAVCNTYNYDPAGGQTQAQFAKQIVAGMLREIVASYEGRQARQAAEEAAVAAGNQ